MKKTSFSSKMKKHFDNFIEYKRQSNYKYKNITPLIKIDKYLVKNFPEALFLTSEICLGYSEYLIDLKMNSRVMCWSALRQFSIYLHQVIPQSETVQHNPFKASQTNRAYLYSKEETQTLMQAAMQLGPRNSIRPYSYQTIIGLLAVTGMRIGEVLALKLADFNPVQQLLLIRNAKLDKDRCLPLAESTTVALIKYLKNRKPHANATSCNAFFITTSGKPILYQSVRKTFESLKRNTIKGKSTDQYPCIHAFRYTYVVNCLIKWDRDHLDIHALLPVMSTYLGHVNVTSTQYYLRTTPELWGNAQQRFHHYFQQSVLGEGGVI